MGTCYICGKSIGILDSTTTVYQGGYPVTVHTACWKGLQQQQAFDAAGPQMYTPSVDDQLPGGEGSDGSDGSGAVSSAVSSVVSAVTTNQTLLYVGGAVAALIVLGAAVSLIKKR